MAIFKEIPRIDGSGVSEYYRVLDGKVTNLNYNDATNKPSINGIELIGNLNIADLGFDGAVESMTGQEISQLTSKDTKVVLCTSDYTYRDATNTLVALERGVVYEIVQGRVVDTILVSGTGSGGGGGSSNPRSNFTVTISPLEQNVAVGAKTELRYYYETTAMPNAGTAKLYVGGKLKSTKAVTNGEYAFDITSYIVSGSNTFQIITEDRNGAKITLDYIVNGIELVLSSSFNDGIVKDVNIDVGYKLTGYGDKILYFILDGNETTMEIKSNKLDAVKSFKGLSHGAHTLIMYAEVDMEGTTVSSNTLEFNFLCADPSNDEILVMSSFNQTQATQGDVLLIDYMVYSNASMTVDTEFQINGETKMSVAAGRTKQYWSVSNYPAGVVTFGIKVGDILIEHVVEVAELDMDLDAVTDNLALYLSAAGRSNQEKDSTRSTWSYGDISAQFNNLNWVSDGWMGNALKLKGVSNVYIPLNIFEEDIRKTGKTIEVEFETFNAFSANSSLVECFANDKGFRVKQNVCEFITEQTSVTAKYNESSRIRVSFVIESSSSNSLIKTYINGILSGLTQYVSTDNLQQTDAVGITLNPDEEEIDVYCIRIYDRALTSEEVLNNYIYDITDNATKIAKYSNNQIYDAATGMVSYTKLKNTMPVLTITGEMPPAKGEKRTVHCIYENVKDPTYNFEFEGCTIDVQGTSSQYYPRKNWKIKLPEKIKFHENAIEENTFCFKADYMDTSHSHNIGSAIVANGLPTDLFPTRKENANVRDTMYGFPCVIFHKDTEDSTPEFYGTYMFNNDKSDSDTLGLTTDKAESWEFCNNTSDHCLFKTNDFSEASGVKDNLEARYPDKNTDYTAIKKLYDWVVECNTTNNLTKFKNEFEQHLNLDYCLNYTVFMEFAMLTDSRAKNMFLDTADGEIWYPRFYDMDTAWGLNNEGVLKFSYDVEIHDRSGSGWVWNDQGESVLWNLFEQAFADEIKERYHLLRKDKLTYEAMMETYVENISDKFVEASYNEDSQFKYVDPLVFDNDSTYLYAAQGSRKDHFKYILTNRITYLDSKYEYGNYNSNYATMRLYTDNADFAITPYTTEYINIKFGSTIKGARCPAGQTTYINSPDGLVFNDTETIIYGASEIASFGDLSTKYPGTVDITRCGKLQDLIIGGADIVNTNLTNISLGNNPLLRTIDVRNCVNLTGALDCSGCTDLREVYAEGSSVTSVILPETNTVTTLHLPKTVTGITLQNQNALTDLYVEDYNSISTLDIGGSDIDVAYLLVGCFNLSRARIEFMDKDNDHNRLPLHFFEELTDYVNGIDAEGFNTEYPTFTGTVVLEVHNGIYTDDELAALKARFATVYPDLTINYVTVNSNIATSCETKTVNGVKSYLVTSYGTKSLLGRFYVVPKKTTKYDPIIGAGNQGFNNYDTIEIYRNPRGGRGMPSILFCDKLKMAIGQHDPSKNLYVDDCPLLHYIGDTSLVEGISYLQDLPKMPDGGVKLPNLKTILNSNYNPPVWKYISGVTWEGITTIGTATTAYYTTGNPNSQTYNPYNFRKMDTHFKFGPEGCESYNSNLITKCTNSTGTGSGHIVNFEADTVDFTGLLAPIANYICADNFEGMNTMTGEYYLDSYGANFGMGTFGPYWSKTLQELELPGIVNLNHANTQVLLGGLNISLPNLEKLYIGNIYYGGSVVYWSKFTPVAQIKLPEMVQLYSDYDDVDVTRSETRCSLAQFLHALNHQVELPALDCSNITYGGSITSASKIPKLIKCGGFINYGKAFNPDNGASYSQYTLNLSSYYYPVANTLNKESLVNILEGLYDLASNGIPAQNIILGSTALAKLTDAEKAIATNKGWNLS